MSEASPVASAARVIVDRSTMIEVRRLAPHDDAVAIGRLLVGAYGALPGYPEDRDYDLTLGNLRAREQHTDVAVAILDDRAVGTVTFLADCTNPHAEFDDPDAASFRYFGVDPAAQGLGVGEAMVRWCIAEAARHGRRRIRIHTLDAMVGAQRLYERLGFVRTPDFDEDWDDVHGVAFVYELDPTS